MRPCALLILAASLCPCFAGSILISDFASSTTETYTGLSAQFTTICGTVPCQPTPLAIDGSSYTTDNNFLRYFDNNSGCPGGDSTCINDDSDLGFIDITLGSAAQAVGGFVNPGNAKFEFYSPGDTLLGSVTVAAANGFGGWADPGGISRIKIIDMNQDASSFFFDSLTVGSVGTSGVPEPSSIVLMGVGLLAMVAGRRARRSRSEV